MIPFDRSKGRPEPIAALNRIDEIECAEPLVDIRAYAPTLRMSRPQVIPYVRRRVAEMVARAIDSIEDVSRPGPRWINQPARALALI